jgi:IS30 family transposase
MTIRARTIYTQAQKTIMWDRWKKGDNLNTIARLFETRHAAISNVVYENGGVRPQPRKRSSGALSLDDREEISRGLATQLSLRAIASQLGRSPSTVSREINRNGGYHRYRAALADKAAWKRALRPRPCKLVGNHRLIRLIGNKLKQQWSPQQIAGWGKRQHPEDERYHVSHETIYKSLFIQARGVLKRSWFNALELSELCATQRNSILRDRAGGKSLTL